MIKMNDLNFVVELCVTAAVPDLTMSRNLLTFARKKIVNNSGVVSEKLMLKVGETLHRLETFVLLQEGEDDVELWLEFTRLKGFSS